MPTGPPVFAIEVENFALVTYDVPAERVEAHLPAPYELDAFAGPGGRRAFVTTTCFCNRRFHPAGVGHPRHTFNESTYRTYVTHKGRKGVYFFGRYLGTSLAWLSQRALARDTFAADFDVATEVAGAKYSHYRCRAASEAGETSFELVAMDDPRSAKPFRTGDELAQFLTYRLHGFYTSSIGVQGYMPVVHPRMSPVAGTLLHGRFDLWDKLGIVSEQKAARPYSVLVVPQVPFTLFAPRPLT